VGDPRSRSVELAHVRLSSSRLRLRGSARAEYDLPVPNPLIIGYHLVWMVYGYWLPNDLRGGMSRSIRNDIIADLGELHYGRKKIQPASKDIRSFYERAKEVLRFPILDIGSDERTVIAEAFQRVIETCKYTCYACAIMPDHIHILILIRKHKDLAEGMIRNLQRESHLLLRERGLRDFAHPVWGGPGWKVFLDHPNDISRTVGYIAENPLKIHAPARTFDFVTPYNNWPLHEGYSAKSPYVRRLKEAGYDV
jgi:REP element-mobilizing transposase RayT